MPEFIPPQGIIKHSGVYSGVVGIAFTGVPIFAGITEADKDPYYPTTRKLKQSIDMCLADVNN